MEAIYGASATGKFATLDADPGTGFADLAITLACINGSKVLMLTPYSGYLPPTVDAYLVGIWDYGVEAWLDGAIEYYNNPILNDEGSGIVISNNIQVRRIMEMFHQADRIQNPNQVLTTGVYNSQDDTEVPFLAEWDTTGLDDAIQYLDCF